MRTLRYALITPARDEEDNLPRLAATLASQTVPPDAWIIVDNGSTDRTPEVANHLASMHDWARVREVAGSQLAERGAPIVRALNAGLEVLGEDVDVVVSLDADVSMAPDYFERLLRAFVADPRLGIASGSAYEEVDGVWTQRFNTGDTVWGAARAFRRECLNDVLPFEERHGWDGLDELKARTKGWRTQTILDLPFRHHRKEGQRDGSRFAHWRMCGESAHYMGYRSWYLVARALHRARFEPAALAMIWGFASSAIRSAPRFPNEEARALLRRDQSLRHLRTRRREALGLEQSLGD
jgi:glycosyltransferase involved in cell wall biosynthesis